MKKITSYKDFNNQKMVLFVKDTYVELSDIEVHEGDLIVEGNQRFFEGKKNKSIYITGDLIVSGTIGFFPSNEYLVFIVGGNVKAKNFINVNQTYIFVGKSLKVEALSFLVQNSYKMKVQGNISTKELIHYGMLSFPEKVTFENAYNFATNDYKYFKSNFYGKENGITTFYFVTLIKSLEKGEAYIDEKATAKLQRKLNYEKQEAIKQEEDFKRNEAYWSTNDNYDAFKKFKYALESYDFDNLDLAGFEFKYNDIQAKILGLHPPEDQLLLDVRAKSGLYALIHAERPEYVKPNKTKRKGFEVKSLDLLNRYSDLKVFIMEKKQMYYKYIFSSLLANHSLTALYEIEKQSFHIDKEVGLYWLIIFGLLEDKRYDEVLENISHFDWEMITGAKEYFIIKEQEKIVNAKEKLAFLKGLNL